MELGILWLVRVPPITIHRINHCFQRNECTAANTSSVLITRLAQDLASPRRATGSQCGPTINLDWSNKVSCSLDGASPFCHSSCKLGEETWRGGAEGILNVAHDRRPALKLAKSNAKDCRLALHKSRRWSSLPCCQDDAILPMITGTKILIARIELQF